MNSASIAAWGVHCTFPQRYPCMAFRIRTDPTIASGVHWRIDATISTKLMSLLSQVIVVIFGTMMMQKSTMANGTLCQYISQNSHVTQYTSSTIFMLIVLNAPCARCVATLSMPYYCLGGCFRLLCEVRHANYMLLEPAHTLTEGPWPEMRSKDKLAFVPTHLPRTPRHKIAAGILD